MKCKTNFMEDFIMSDLAATNCGCGEEDVAADVKTVVAAATAADVEILP